MSVSLKLSKKEKHVSRPSREVEHLTRSNQLTLTSQDTLPSWPHQLYIMAKSAPRKKKWDVENKSLPENGVITTIHHGMICLNARLGRHFWKNCRPSTCPTKIHHSTPTNQETLLSQPHQRNIMEKNTLRKTKGNVVQKTMSRNGVNTTIHHGMIRLNARLGRHFWKNCQALTCPTKPW